MNITSSQTPSFHGRREPRTRLRKSTVWRLSSYNHQINGFREGEIEKRFFVTVYMCKFNYIIIIITVNHEMHACI